MVRVRYSPMTDFGYLFDQMDRMAQEVLGGTAQSRVATLPVDVFDRGEELIVRAFVPGVHPDSLDITIDDGVLTIAGHFPELYDSEDASSWTWYNRELRTGKFRRSFNLPYKVEMGEVSASVEDGILWLKLPKAAEAKPHRIAISGGDRLHEVEATATSSQS